MSESYSPLFHLPKSSSRKSSKITADPATLTAHVTTSRTDSNNNNDNTLNNCSGSSGEANEQGETCVTTTSLEEFDTTNRAEQVKDILGSSLDEVNGFVCDPDLFGEDERRLHSFLDGRELQELYIKAPRDKVMELYSSNN